jgi:hypothetical protein
VKKLLLVIITLAIFAVGVALFPLMLLLRPSVTYKAMNRFCGAVYLGFDGKETISKTCGQRLAAGVNCSICKKLCPMLAELDPNHCEKEAA